MTNLFQVQNLKQPKAEDIEIDKNVIAAIPDSRDAVSFSASVFGMSFWTRTACVVVKFQGDREQRYFLKVVSGESGRGMVEGEYESMKVIHSVTPNFAPEPIAWGTYETNKDLHFFLCDFCDMDNEIPELKRFVDNLAQLHRNSSSPNGKFGFHVTTYNGNIPQDVRWTETWEECFINGTRKDFELEEEARGPSEELESLKASLFEKVIPRLLRPLESNGRGIKPSFVHGDLWHGNASNDINTNHPLVFDAAGLYGHSEFDIKAMRISRYRFGRDYMDAYHSHNPIAAPVEDLDARLALYSLRSESYLHESTLFVSDPARREELIREIRNLVEMFPDGLDGWKAG